MDKTSKVMGRYFLGEWVSGENPLTVDEVALLCRKAEQNRMEMARYPQDKILQLLKEVHDLWKNPLYPRLKTLREKLPAETGFSSEMIELGIQELVWTLDPEVLVKKLNAEMRSVPPTPEFLYRPESQTLLHREPLGIVLHVLSGNVFLVGVGSLMEGLLTNNITFLKMSSHEKVFLPELIRSIQEVDKDGVVSRSIALVDYASTQTEVISEFKKRVDGIVVWGGEDAVKAYRSGLPARSRLILFGPKLSLAVVTNEGLAREGLANVAGSLAFEISIWDQNACTAPQLCFVEGEKNAKALLEALSSQLELKASQLPAGDTDLHTAVEIQKLRSVAELAESRGEGKLFGSRGNVDWTVYYSKDPTIEPSPLHRTLKIVPYESLDTVFCEMQKLRGYLQTVGLSAGESESQELRLELASRGALRIFAIGQMTGGEIDDPHDGAYDLPQLVNFIVTRLPKKSFETGDPHDFLPLNWKQQILDQRLRTLVGKARSSLFYQARFAGLEINSVKDLVKVPVLTRQQMESNMPPAGQGLQTGVYQGGYVSRSGGSTGAPKFSIYDSRDWENLVSEAVRVLRASGLEKRDRVANCMLAGDLYGSFVSFDHINCRVGAMTFAFAGQVTPEVFLDTWRKFNINCLQAMPSVAVPLLRAVKRLEPTFTLEKFIYAGVPLSGSDRQWLIANLSMKRISSIIGANDGGQLAYQCESQSGAFHHVVDDFNYVEIVDDNGLPVADGESGKVVITSLLKFAFPLIRYDLGDSARFVNQPCACGRTARVIEYLGRSDDTICIGNMNVRYRDIAEALKAFPISALQVIAKNEPDGEYLCLKAETEVIGEAAAEELYRALLNKEPKLQERLHDKSLLRVEVECVKPGTLPRNPRSGKIKTLCDERK